MEKMKVGRFKMSNGEMYCVGSERGIQDLQNFFSVQCENRKCVNLDAWVKRVLNNKVYCCLIESKKLGFITSSLVNRVFKKANLLIDEDIWFEALFLTEPQKISELLGLSEKDAEEVKENSWWKDKFLY